MTLIKDELLHFYKRALLGNTASESPLCETYRQEWAKCGKDKEKLVTLSLKQQAIPYFATACAKRYGLSRKYIMANFGDYINGYEIKDADNIKGYSYGLYIDYPYNEDLDVIRDVSHIMWCVGTSVVIPQTKCPTIYVSNRSNVHIVCEGYNSIRIYLFDNSKVTLEDCDETCDITIFKYSEQCKVEKGQYCLSNKIHEHQKTLTL